VQSEREWREVVCDGIRLAYCASSSAGTPLIFLHGLAGHAGEWNASADVAERLGFRTLAVELRGHGRSDHRPADRSLDALVEDVRCLARQTEAPAVVCGQSLGGRVAFCFAARYPALVEALVIVEADPEADPTTAASIATWLDRWTVPFQTHAEAHAFFRGGAVGHAWASGLEQRPDGLWPRFERAVILDLIDDASREDRWDEWRGVECPTLLVRGEHGFVAPDVAARMVAQGRDVRLVEIAGVGHDVHLEGGARWLDELRTFLAHR
jgi:pimeloyl-ACP methyl ester carboxylesterase